MKKKLISIFVSNLMLLVVLFHPSCKNSELPGNEDFGIKNCSSVDTLLQTFENNVIVASDYCLFKSNTSDSLNVLLKQINNLEQTSKTNISFLKYNKAFCLLHISISQMQLKQDGKADTTITQALDILDGIQNKNSEVYSLLAILQGISINYRSAMTLTVAAEKCKLYAEKAIMLNDKNPRAHLALGIYDFYTPVLYQGGKIVENCLLKSLELSKNTPKSVSCLPNWGKDWTYRYIIQYYLKNKKNEIAKTYLNEALLQFPNNLFLLETRKKI